MRAGQPGSVFDKANTVGKINNEMKARPFTAHNRNFSATQDVIYEKQSQGPQSGK
jgi:hypothetical protein